MLHLQAGVHLHEEEVHVDLARRWVVALLYDEFNRASTHIIHGTCGGHCGLAHLFSERFCHTRCRCFFQHLLVTTLHRAVALHEVHAVALRIAKHLNFNVAGALYIFFNQHRLIAKTVLRFALARRQGLGKVFRLFYGAHAFATTAGAGFDQHRVANAIGFALQQLRVLIGAVIARHQRHAGFFHELLGLCFQAHGLNGGGGRANEHQARFGAGLGKGFVLT